MGASLFIGMNDNGQKPSNFQRTGGFVNGDYWDAFGDLLDEVFLLNYPQFHEKIKLEEGEYLKFYTFEDLNKADFNLSVKLIREYLTIMSPSDWQPKDYIRNMEEWQSMAREVWEDIAEPYVGLDRRYDASLAGARSL